MDKNNSEPGSLLVKTTKLLQKADLIDIAYHTEIPYLWLVRIKDSKINDPSVNRIQTVYEYLKNKKLC